MWIALLGIALGFGLLRIIPGAKLVNLVVSWVAIVLLLGLSLTAVGFPQVSVFVNSFPNVYALTVGFLGGSVLSSLLG